MNLQLVRDSNRRVGRQDRRQCPDRRASVRISNPTDTEATLRELLREAHERIRMLEHAVEVLKQAV